MSVLSSISGAAREVCRQSLLLNSLTQYAYLYGYRPPSFWSGYNGTSERYASPSGQVQTGQARVAFICDEMTWLDFSGCCDAIFLLPGFWREQMEAFQPDLLFCESAWSGIEECDGCWRGRVYRNRKVLFENRKELLAILAYCRERGIRTAFWNKEDPALFGHRRYDFVDTALRFDAVFTTAWECVSRYRKLGAKNVALLPFGVNTDLFYPGTQERRKDSVIFTGSWFADQKQRCADLSALLDYVIRQGLQLDIYDRHAASPEQRFRFPKRYRPYLRPAVPYRQIPALVRRYEWAVNVNTVTDSETMFSRRLLQAAACGAKVLSSPSRGVERIPGSRRVFLDSVGEALEVICDFETLKSLYSTRQLFSGVLKSAMEEIPSVTGKEAIHLP